MTSGARRRRVAVNADRNVVMVKNSGGIRRSMALASVAILSLAYV